MRSIIWVLALSILLSTLSSCGHVSKDLRVVVVDRKISVIQEDIRDLSLKFDTQDGLFYAVILLSDKGEQKMESVLKGHMGKELFFYYGTKKLHPGLPIFTEHIDSLMVKFDKEKDAIHFMKTAGQ